MALSCTLCYYAYHPIDGVEKMGEVYSPMANVLKAKEYELIYAYTAAEPESASVYLPSIVVRKSGSLIGSVVT